MTKQELLKYFANGKINKKELETFLDEVEKEYTPNEPFGDTVEKYDVEREKELEDLFDRIVPRPRPKNDLEILINGDENRWN